MDNQKFSQKSFVYGLILLFVVGCSPATTPIPIPSTSTPVPPKSITGRIFLSQASQPLSGASVSLRPANSQEKISEVQADEDGHFAMLGIEPGSYNMLVFSEISDESLWPCSTKPKPGEFLVERATGKVETTAGEAEVLALVGNQDSTYNISVDVKNIIMKAGDSIILDITITSC